MNILIDNYDSFSYNLYQYLGELTPDIMVIRNDEKSIDELRELDPKHIIISPGPGRPERRKRRQVRWSSRLAGGSASS